MANWYNRNYETSPKPKSRWSFSVEADVFVPEDPNEEVERETADKVLRDVLGRVEGDASQSGIDANVKFDVQFEPLKIR